MMTPRHSPTFERIASEIVAVSRVLHARGWAFATSGNFSARLDASAIVITASGLDKGEITEESLLTIDLEGSPIPPSTGKPSAETPLHTSLYARSREIGAVLHVHAPASTTMSTFAGKGGEVRLEGWEMLKALEGVTTHDHLEVVPVIANDQDTERLAASAAERLDRSPLAHAYLIEGHGLYTWGRTIAAAKRHVEALELLFDCEMRRMMLKRGAT